MDSGTDDNRVHIQNAERISASPRPIITQYEMRKQQIEIRTMKKTLFSLVAVLSLAGAALADQTPDHKVLVLKNKDGAAILGYDAVAYFTDNKPMKGNPKFQSEYEGAKYHFASGEHKALFDANPAKYAPAYGGYCGYAASIDRLSPISPEWFQIIDCRPVPQQHKKAAEKWHAD